MTPTADFSQLFLGGILQPNDEERLLAVFTLRQFNRASRGVGAEQTGVAPLSIRSSKRHCKRILYD